jgi:hypothetical protein
MTTLTPDYLSIDYTTLLTRLKEQLQASDTFADYNFEGANITILLELIAYIAEMNSFFANKIAKNVHIETADIYEAVNRSARQMGYEPKGAISSSTTLTVTVTGATPGHTYRVFPFSQIECPQDQDEDGDTIKFANTILFSQTPTASEFTFDMRVRQGTVTELTGYTGSDLVDNELLLPSNYAYDSNLDDEYPSLIVTVNGYEWTRVPDFWDELSAYRTVDNVYMFIYDRYGRSKLVFSSSRNVPGTDDVIEITVLESLGADGNVGANSITKPETEFMYDVDDAVYLEESKVIVTNDSSSTGGADVEDITTIKEAAKASLHTQYRNVTDVDYESHLEERSDVVVAQAWGEQEIAPSGSYNNFNKVFLSVIPDEWGSGSINSADDYFTVSWGSSATDVIMSPSAYNPTWTSELSLYLEPRKMISAYEVWKLPVLIYFSLDFSVRVKRGYTFSLVQSDIINKVDYWFRNANQDFNDIINFNDILEFVLDVTQVSPDDEFSYIRGIRNLNLRDMDVSHHIYENNDNGLFPYYVEDASTYRGDNKLRRIQLGYDQFPVLSKDTIRVTQES